MKYFGTDGFRGKANDSLTAQHAFNVGSCLGYLLRKEHLKPVVLIGKDTRLSSSMFESAIAAGLSSHGCDVKLLGVVPTPTVSYETAHTDASAAVMISASHNPYYDNGLKLFNQNGEKMDPETEQFIESFLDHQMEIILPDNSYIGTIEVAEGAVEDYFEHLVSSVDGIDLSGIKVVLDCANGSAVTTAETIFKRLNADVIVMNNIPNGININVDAGSTHPQGLQNRVVALGADMGFAFDGDADRCIAVDHLGQLVDGDKILYACGNFMRDRGELNNDLIVTTVMANLGLHKKLQELNFNVDITKVGDKYVYESMLENDGMLGGEQSGHIIFKQYANTGDGVLTAIQLAKVVKMTGKSLHENTKELKIYPQTLKNVKVVDKELATSDPDVRKKMSEIDHRLKDTGRLLVRPSGTEQLIRVMVEAESQEMCDTCVDEIIEIITNKGL